MLDHQTQAVLLEVRRGADDPGGVEGGGVCVVTISDPELLGHQAELVLNLHCEVHDGRGIDAERELFRTQIELTQPRMEIPIPEPALCCYSYDGKQIGLTVEATLEIDDGILFDSKAEAAQSLPLPERPGARDDAQELIEPGDAFDFVANFRVIAPHRQGIVMLLMIVGAILILVNTWVGYHDQTSPDELTYVYSHYDSDGDAQSPFFGSLMVSGAAGALVWVAIRAQLRRYMRFRFKHPGAPKRQVTIPAAALIHGVARCDLNDFTVRVVAANRERGQYTRGSGTQQRTVSFATPVRAVLLYETRVEHVPAGTPIERYLEGEVRFEPMFVHLYPPVHVGTSHGLDVVWEVQLLHPELVDQELQGNAGGLEYREFFAA